VEGGITNNDWNYFATSKKIVERIRALTKPSIFYKGLSQVELQPADRAVRAWEPEYYEKDFELARNLGMNAFRISIEWSRIEPSRGQWNFEAINHYKGIIKSIIKRGMIPIITLNHLTLPLWVLTPPMVFRKKFGQSVLPSPLRDISLGDPIRTDPYWKSLGGWENYETVREFIEFVEKVVLEFKDLVDYWITLSEPVASVIGVGYVAGLWSPGFFLAGNRAKRVLHNLLEAHVLAYDTISALDDVDADGDGLPKMVGFTHAMMAVKTAQPSRFLGITLDDNKEAAKNFDYFINDYFINAVVKGEEDLNYLDTLQRHNRSSKNFIIHENWKNKTDFIGINYYRRVYICHSNIVTLSSAKFVGGKLINNLLIEGQNQPHNILSDLGWEIYPEGLYQIIMHIKGNWKLPILVTENGVADKSDRYRAPFLISHLEQLKRAIDNDADVIGYLHWSFMDNYEWLENYRPEAKFGLYRIDHNNKNNLVRQATKGAEALKLIIEESCNDCHDVRLTDAALLKAKRNFGFFTPDGSSLIKDDKQ
jgi:beta-glucosidase